ncbi:MAG: CDP-alcohol phosphatidyltransferase family protein [Steroidobacteraceae bacterium]|jgi:phosphatidylglycerophosphate synthase
MMSSVNLPNALSIFRFFGSPLLFVFDTQTNQTALLAWFGLLGLSDFLDGWLARRWQQTSERGAMLDGVADLVFYPCAALLLYQWFPAVVMANLAFIALAIGMLGLMLTVSWFKCGRLILLHTHLNRTAAVGVVLVVFTSFVIDTSWMLRATALLYTLGFVEGIAIFLRYGAVPADTRSLFAITENPPPSAAHVPAVLRAPRSD